MFERIQSPILRTLLDWLFSILFALLVFFVVRGFIFRTAQVDGTSMVPTLEHGDMLILNKFAYVIGKPQVGDIVAFPYAQNKSEYYIKRVIAEAGDEVDLRAGSFWVNNVQLKDNFSHEAIITTGDVEFPIEIEDGHFFVLGDNRNGSRDSRFTSVGTIHEKEIIGRAGVRFWPLKRIGTVRKSAGH